MTSPTSGKEDPVTRAKRHKNFVPIRLEKRLNRITRVPYTAEREVQKIASAWGMKPDGWFIIETDEELLKLSPFETHQHLFVGPNVSEQLLKARGWKQ